MCDVTEMTTGLKNRVIAFRTIYGRPMRFAIVGAVCFGVQYVIMVALAAVAGIPWPIANAVGFFGSARLNFLLSSAFTWGDRETKLGWTRWLSYNVAVVLGLVVNSAAFAVLYPVVAPTIAAAGGVAASMVFTYLVGNHMIFRRAAVVSEVRAG